MASDTLPFLSPDVVRHVNKLGFQLQYLTVNDKESSGICAINVYHCLMMVAAGSTGKTMAAFSTALGFLQASLYEAADYTVKLNHYLKTNGSVELSSAGSVWYKENLLLEEKWRETVETVFGATVAPMKLAPMNEFVEKETQGNIKQLVTKREVDNAVLMLITCLYFKAKWATPFATSMTDRSATFYPFDNGKSQTCSMMHRVDDMDYREDPRMQVCVLPYRSTGGESNTPTPIWKAAIILPKTPGLSAMKDILHSTSESLSALHNLLIGTTQATHKPPQQKLNLYLPSFKQNVKLDLKEPLIALGLSPAFTPSSDFEPMTKGPMMINAVTHNLVIAVDEEGTEMAAATKVTLSRSRKTVTEMRVNRPFLFVVFDEVSNLVLCSVIVNSVEE